MSLIDQLRPDRFTGDRQMQIASERINIGRCRVERRGSSDLWDGPCGAGDHGKTDLLCFEEWEAEPFVERWVGQY